MSIETRVYKHGEIYTLGRLDYVLHLRHNLEQLTKAGIYEKRVFLHNQDDPQVAKEVRYPITNRLMFALEVAIESLEATAIGMGLQRDVVDIVDKYSPKPNDRDPKA